MIEARVCGIPCLLDVTYSSYCAPRGKWADNSDECYGWDEVEFEVCDRRGRPAEWLKKKMTKKDWDDAEKQVRESRNSF